MGFSLFYSFWGKVMTTELDDIDFAHLIGDKDIDVCKLIEAMHEDGIALVLFRYTRDVIKRRWTEAEPYIIEYGWAFNYSRYFGVKL